MKVSCRKMLAAGAALAVLLAVICIVHIRSRQEIVLEFGTFAGSNWDVANANSFIIFDKAIERFEAEHPGVKIHYYSGVMKDDYSEWFSRKLLAGEEPDVFMVLGTDFNQFSSMGIMRNLDDLMAADEDFDESMYFSSAFHTGQYGGGFSMRCPTRRCRR